MKATVTTDQAFDDAKAAHDANRTDFTVLYQDIVQLQQQNQTNPSQFKANMGELNRRLLDANILPDFDLTGVDDKSHLVGSRAGQSVDLVAGNVQDSFQPGEGSTLWQGTKNIASDIGSGALDEVEHHAGRVALSAGVGLALGIGAAFVAPEIAVGAGVAGLAYGAFRLAERIPGWVHDGSVVANPNQYSSNELNKATAGIQKIGSGGVDVAAGVAGGIAGGYIGSAIKVSMTAPVNDVPPPPKESGNPPDSREPLSLDDTAHHAHTQHGTIAGVTTQINDPTKSVVTGDPTNGMAIPIDTSHGATLVSTADPTQSGIHAHLAGLNPNGDASNGLGDVPSTETTIASAESTVVTTEPKVAISEPKVVTPEPKVVTPEPTSAVEKTAEVSAAPELTVQQSVSMNQGMFRSANDAGDVVSATKQAYNVMFEKVTEPSTVPTLENPAGEPVQPGQWIATRLNPDGSPVMENGLINRWPVTDKTILKTYQTTAEDLANSLKVVAGTKTDAPPVHMVELAKPIDIMTPWGSMHGDAGAWLANYDYNPVTGEPGSSYAIITQKSFGQTYQIMPKPSST